MSLYEGAVKKPIMTSLCFLGSGYIWSVLSVEIAGRPLSGHRDQHHYGDDDLSGCQCLGHRE